METRDIFFMVLYTFVVFWSGMLIGTSAVSKPQTTYNNTQAVIDCATTLNKCMDGWRGTLDTLNSCNNLIK